MSPPPPSSSFDALLAHASFLSSLARELARDAHRADDLVQQTWVAALEHPPRGDAPLKSWLAAVVRNLARQQRRADGRRSRREALVAHAEATNGPDELVQQIASQQALLRAVLELDEPYRGAIHERYYEGLAPREIAQRHGLALKTVKTRLNRGLALLRARLDREHGGDRSAWLLALVPLTARPSWTVPALGALLVDAKLKVALVCVALIGVAGSVVFVSNREATPIASRIAPVDARAGSPGALEDANELALAPLAGDDRHALDAVTPAAPSTAPDASSSELRTLRGRVLDLEHRPVAGIDLVERGESVSDAVQQRTSTRAAPPMALVLATSRSDGTFELATPRNTLVLEARGSTFVTVLGARLAHDYSKAKPIVVVAPRQALAGLVLDPDGKPVANARVEVVLPASVRAGMAEILDHSYLTAWNTSTDERGHFAFDDAPGCVGELSASSPAFEKTSIPLPSLPSYDLVLRLGATTNPHLVVRGIVVDQHGTPVDQAYVALGEQTVLSAPDGSFELEADLDPRSIRMAQTPPGSGPWEPGIDLRAVRAVKLGHLPAIHPLPAIEELRAHPELDPIRLELGGETLSIEGRVEDMNGKPLTGVVVWPLDGTKFGWIVFKTGREGYSLPATIEAMLRGGPRVENARSDADGRFLLDGLCDREYELAAFDAPTMRSTRVERVRAGSRGVVIKLRAEAELVRIGGRVVTEGGAPVADTRVTVFTYITTDGMPSYGPAMTTDDEGRFGFVGEAAPGLRFQCSSESLLPLLAFEPKPEQRLDELEIVVWLRYHLQIDLGDRKDKADQFAALDAAGELTPIMIFHGPMAMFGERMPITDGKSEAAAVRESCKTIVLYKEQREVGRLPVTLKQAELNVVRF